MDNTDRANPYHRLLAGILLQAATDIKPYGEYRPTTYSNLVRGRERQQYQDEAREFVEDQSEEPFSFNWICYHLEIDPQVLRRKMLTTIIDSYIRPCIT